jgi:hypothetical protein
MPGGSRERECRCGEQLGGAALADARDGRARARHGETSLRPPDLACWLALVSAIAKTDHPFALAIEDGLSALSVARHTVPLVRALIAFQGRVALCDEIGAAFGARIETLATPAHCVKLLRYSN